MKSIKRISILVVAIFSLSITSCDLDINVDPNNPNPTTVPNSQLLSSAEIAIFTSFGPNGSGLGQPASIWVHQTMIRSSADNYNPTGTDGNISTPWLNLYAGALTDLESIIKVGTEQEQFQYVGIAKILKAYAFANMVDVWGDVPFSEANVGASKPFPVYDKGSVIYPQLFTLIDEAILDIAKAVPASGIVPLADDLIYGGSVAKWRRFAKVLKLRMYNTVRKFQNVSSQVTALVADPDVTGFVDDFEMKYINLAAPENRNPAYVSVSGAVTYFSRYFYEILNNKSTLNTILTGIVDPRLNYYLYNSLGSSNTTPQNPTEYKDGNFLSINFASQGPNQGFDQSKGLSSPGVYFCGGKYDPVSSTATMSGNVGGSILIATWGTGSAPQRLFPKYQATYIRAELAIAGATTEDPRVLLDQAIDESFAKVNSIATGASSAPAIPLATISAYKAAVLALYDALSPDGKLEMIMTQKWIANFGNPLESYSDYRRTGYPKMFDPNNDEFGYTNASRTYPFSYPWRQTDLQLNPNAPAQKLVGDPSARVFWDVD
jgi:hypothetical protein